MAVEVCYICDGQLPCAKEAGCFLNGGNCSHTRDVSHAKNFKSVKELVPEEEHSVCGSLDFDDRYFEQ